jgi:hypothetical protein
MSDLVFIAFDNEKQAEEVRDKVLAMQREYLIEVDDAVVVTRDQNGRVKLNQLMHPTAGGAVAGAFLGHADRLAFSDAVGGRSCRRSRGRARRLAGRRRDQRSRHETTGERGAEAGDGRPLSSHPQDDDR